MKKFFAVVLAAIMCFSLVACSNADDKESSSNESQSVSDTQESSAEETSAE